MGVGDELRAPAPKRAAGMRWLLAGSVVAGLGGLALVVTAVVFGAASAAVQPQAAAEAAPREAPAPPSGPGGGAVEPDVEAEATLGVDAEWVTRIAGRTGIPERALQSYAEAASRLSRETPGCGLGWNTLAGIGLVESEHGTIDGGAIAANGRISPPLVGIPLDGTSTRAIPDTDGGALDHDTVWDRAVGPMQFIPSTWEVWASDGNGDGIEDPQNLDDAAYAAARYLCATGGDLTNPDGWIAAVAAYNDAVDYNHRVADAADHYASHSQ